MDTNTAANTIAGMNSTQLLAGAVVILGGVVGFGLKLLIAQVRRQGETLDQRHNELMQLQKDTVGALQSSTDTLKRANDLMDKCKSNQPKQ